MSHIPATFWHGYDTENRAVQLTVESPDVPHTEIASATLRITGLEPVSLAISESTDPVGYTLTAPITLTEGVYSWTAEVIDPLGMVTVARGVLSVSPRVAVAAE